MDQIKLSTIPTRFKLLATTLLCVIGLIYIVLLVNIWIDTELRPSIIIEAYGDMEYIELTANAHIDLPHYTLLILAIPVFLFMFSSFGEKLKRFMAIFPFAMAVTDVGSMYLIPYGHKVIFSYTLWIAGFLCALSFFALFIMINYDFWFNKKS